MPLPTESNPGRDMRLSVQCLGVVMPAYNEVGTIAAIVEAVLAQPEVLELVVVDDCSTDGTWDVLERLARREPRIKVVRHQSNLGKGAALQTGFAETSSPVVIVQDADLEYDPGEYELLLAPIRAGKADVVLGSRFLGGGARRVLYYWHAVANKLLTMLSDMATNLNLTDMETGFKMFRRDVLERITLEEKRFGVEPEIIAKVARQKVRVYEVPISYYGRTYAEGKKIGLRDAVSALRCIIKYNMFR